MGKALTAIAVANLKPGPARREVPDPGARNLYLIIQPSGAKGFAVRYRFKGKPRKLTLPAGCTLAEARALAAKALVELERGNDPNSAKLEARRAQQDAAANTFQFICEQYLEREGKKREGERLRSLAWRRELLERLVYPTLGAVPIHKIKRKAVIELLDAIEDGKLKNPAGKPIKGGATMAHSVLAVIRKIMRWHAIRDEDYLVPVVPGMGRIKAKERARSRVLDDNELRAVWAAADANGPFGAFVRFLLLTGARRTEAAAMAWDEVPDTDWILPPHRNKVKLELVRPLSKAALDVLKTQPRVEGCPFVFTLGSRPLASFSQGKDALAAASGTTGWTLHDLRRTARSLMSKAGVNADHAERCLGHVIGGIRGTYDRHEFHEEKRHAYEALAAQIQRIVHHPPKGNVRQLRG
jgi:integrase